MLYEVYMRTFLMLLIGIPLPLILIYNLFF